jgi:hypothetical protein
MSCQLLEAASPKAPCYPNVAAQFHRTGRAVGLGLPILTDAPSSPHPVPMVWGSEYVLLKWVKPSENSICQLSDRRILLLRSDFAKGTAGP